jgi:hypothetical protein
VFIIGRRCSKCGGAAGGSSLLLKQENSLRSGGYAHERWFRLGPRDVPRHGWRSPDHDEKQNTENDEHEEEIDTGGFCGWNSAHLFCFFSIYRGEGFIVCNDPTTPGSAAITSTMPEDPDALVRPVRELSSSMC